MKNIHGSCLCDSVRFSVAADDLRLYQCHCSICRKVSGSACGTAFFVRKPSFEWLRGQDGVRVFQRESGYSVHFCSTCGSPLPHAFMGEYVWVPAGLLEASAEGSIVMHLHLASKAHWEAVMPADCVQYAGSPALAELLRLTVADDAGSRR